MSSYYLLAGTNQGDRTKNLKTALERISRHPVKIHEISSVYETEAWGKLDQDNFLNQAALVHTSLSAEDTLLKCKDIEKQMGSFKTETWGPRTIDIDVLFYNESIIDKENIKIPHPMIEKRNFVLIPLMEIAGDMVHPVLEKTIEELYEESNDSCEVWIFD